VRTYGQYCPIARGAEIFAERWTPLIIRNLYLGCGSFSEILEGAPGLSRTLLSQRLKQLERLGVVESAPKPDGRGQHYRLTSAGHDLFTVCRSLGEWGARWLEIAPENLDPFVALWSMCNALRRDRLPDRRVVIRFDFTGRPHRERYWLLIELGDTEICKTYPTRISTSRRTPKPSSNGTPASSPGPKLRARAASNSTASRRWSEPSQLGTPAACSPTSGRSHAPPRAPLADIVDAASPCGTTLTTECDADKR
jgi:DNA-binding HxlR family transcriptional regulator